jgi:arsenate-mycothiol transferase
VLFVRVKNGGKSQLPAGLMRKIAREAAVVHSAGPWPGISINRLSAEALAEVGIDISDQTPKPTDAELLRDVEVVVTLHVEALVVGVDHVTNL